MNKFKCKQIENIIDLLKNNTAILIVAFVVDFIIGMFAGAGMICATIKTIKKLTLT